MMRAGRRFGSLSHICMRTQSCTVVETRGTHLLLDGCALGGRRHRPRCRPHRRVAAPCVSLAAHFLIIHIHSSPSLAPHPLNPPPHHPHSHNHAHAHPPPLPAPRQPNGRCTLCVPGTRRSLVRPPNRPCDRPSSCAPRLGDPNRMLALASLGCWPPQHHRAVANPLLRSQVPRPLRASTPRPPR